jgi:hypothetical protein
MTEKRNIVGFKKFSDIKSRSKIEEIDPSLQVSASKDSDRPMNPNLPKDSDKIEKTIKSDIMPNDYTSEDETKNESEVGFKGRVAKFPKNVKASKAYNFMENVKISKKSIWYIMIEKMDNELQVLKYNYREGVDLNKFMNELKSYYINKYKDDVKLCESINMMKIDGNDKYSYIVNIPPIEIDGKKIITKLSEDLIKLLSK